MKHLSPILVLALLAGCATSATPNYDAKFGEAVRQARQAMTLNPSPANAASIDGMDGRAAVEAVGRYQDAFKAPPPVVNVINIGGSAGSSR
jgi:uncharacterized lipoprotein YajG